MSETDLGSSDIAIFQNQTSNTSMIVLEVANSRADGSSEWRNVLCICRCKLGYGPKDRHLALAREHYE
jgi:hypothetical protein